MVHSSPIGMIRSMFRSVRPFTWLLVIMPCLATSLIAQTSYQPTVPGVSDAAPVTNDNRTGADTKQAEDSPSLKTRQDRQDRTIRLGPGDLLQITVYSAPDLTTEARVNAAGNITMPLIGSVHVAGLSTDQAQQLLASRLRDGGLVLDPQVNVFAKEYANGGIAVMGEVQRPGIYTLMGERRLYDAISAAGGTTSRAGRAITITHPSDPQKPLIVDLDYSNPSKSPAGNIDVFPGDTVVVSRAGVVYVVGAVNHPAGFVMDNNEKLTVLQAVALAGGTKNTSSLKGAKILRKTPDGLEEIPIPLNKILEAKSEDPPLKAEDILFVPNSAGKVVAITGAQAAVAVATGLAIYRP
jgi:polysaccharide export outer membrane protein